jgi:hypothetical protein
MHALLAYLADQGFPGAPRPLGFDEQGREVLTFLEGETIGHRKPRPAWVYAEDTLVQVARWMRGCHQIAAGFVPPPGAVWRQGGTWSPGLIIAHNDALPTTLPGTRPRSPGSSTGTSPGPPRRSGIWPWPPSAGCRCTPGTWSPPRGSPTSRAGPAGSAGSSAPTAGQEPPGSSATWWRRGCRPTPPVSAARPLRETPSGRLLRQGVPDAIDQALADLASFPR